MEQFYDVEAVRRAFPVAERMLYLDAAHQTPLATPVRDALLRFYQEGHDYAGPKSLWLSRVEETRHRVASLLNADASEIAFTKNTSEGMNIAANALPLQPGDNVLLVEGDHPNNAYAFLNLRRKGIEIRFVRLQGETADASTFEGAIDHRTRAISLSHVTFHAGHLFDLADIGRLCRDRGLFFVVDAMQSIGVVPLDARAIGATFIGAGCHKGLLTPQGLGILYCSSEIENFEPAYLAMSSLAHPPADYIARQENMALREDAGRFEIGNFNLSDIHALAASLDLIKGLGVANIEAHLYALGDVLIAACDELRIQLVGPRDRANRSPHIYVLDLPGPGWLEYFTEENVRVSPERDGVRISFGIYSTSADVERFASLITLRLDRLQSHHRES
jgi:selenocysteine lyase/cysteine desulfurase